MEIRLHLSSATALSAALLVAAATLLACKGEDRTDNLALVNHDEDQFPGNDNEYPEPGPPEAPPTVGTVNSYARGDDDGGLDDDTYSNIFRRDAEDVDGATYTTEADADIPQVDPAGKNLSRPGTAGLALDSTPQRRFSLDGDGEAGGAPSASTIERYDPADPEDETLRREIQDPQDPMPYGNNIAIDGPTIAEERAAAERDAANPDFDAGIAGGQQTAIGAVGYANSELDEYYDTDEEDYRADAGSSGESWGSWYRPLDPYERGYDERTIQLGPPEEGLGLDARYEAIQRRIYDVPENQQSVVYAPNDYTYQFLTSWDGIAMSAEGENELGGGNEIAYDRPPLMGSGCEQADDPVTCSTAELDKSLQRFLNDGRVLRSMMRAGIDGINFDVDTAGQVVPSSVRALASGRVCEDDDCRRFNRAMAVALRKQEWTPGTRFGRVTDARVNLKLKYRQTEEQIDFEADEASSLR